MFIKGLGEFKLTGAINECEPLLRVLRLRTFSYKPHMMVTYDEENNYRFCSYDEDDPGGVILVWDMTLEDAEKFFFNTYEWY